MMNFQRFSSETLTPGRFSRINQIDMAIADIIDNHEKVTQYSAGRGSEGHVSVNSDSIISPEPPNVNWRLESLSGGRDLFDFATTMLAPAAHVDPVKSNKIPRVSLNPVADQGARLKEMIITPEKPLMRLRTFIRVSRSDFMKIWAITAETSGEAPTIMAANAPSTMVIPI